MADTNDRGLLEANAAEQAAQLIDRALSAIAAQNAAAKAGEARLFFPSGIELISLRFDAGSSIKIGFVIAGKEAKYGEALAIEGRSATADGPEAAP